jgi:hypothetical protein
LRFEVERFIVKLLLESSSNAMCLLALYFRVAEDAPIIVGANREELYERGGDPPRILAGPCRAVAGTDPKAGGTWLGVNEHGLIIAVTNRSKTELPAQPRSRGLLARELLGLRSAAEAREEAVQQLGKNQYAGCNLLVVDRESAVVVHAGDWLRVRFLPPGIHCLTASDVDDGGDRRLAHALWFLNNHAYGLADQCVLALKSLCPQTGNGTPPICVHGERGGTVSSSIIVLRPMLLQSRYWHAQGSPDRTPYADYSSLLRQLDPAGTSST